MGTLVCTIELDKNTGLTVTIDNADAKITQTIKMNGTTIELSVKGSDATSTFTQDAKKIAIACTQFEVVAQESILMSSQNESTYKSVQTLDVQTTNLTLEGKSQAAMSGASAEVKANGTLNLESSGVATLKGAMTNVQGNLVSLG